MLRRPNDFGFEANITCKEQLKSNALLTIMLKGSLFVEAEMGFHGDNVLSTMNNLFSNRKLCQQ